VQTFDSAKYPTETSVREAVQSQLSCLNAGALAGKAAERKAMIDPEHDLPIKQQAETLGIRPSGLHLLRP